MQCRKNIIYGEFIGRAVCDMAGRLSDAWLDDLRSRNDIVDVVSDYVVLKQKGRKHWGLCPFHHEKTASFSVDGESQLYYCFGCHEGGNVIHFVMKLERLEFMEAVTQLAERAHMTMPEAQPGAANAPSRELKERLYLANQAAARYYHNLLYAPEGAAVLNYLHKRGLDDADIRRFGLGASPAGWNDLTNALQQEGFTEEELIKAGLTGRKEHRSYDMFRERAMFPIINAQGRVLGFGGRAMGDAQPKYLNTSDTPVFNKRQGLYALNMARKDGQQKRIILVEGYMDVVALRRMGIPGVVATLGTALTEEQARLIKRYAPEVWVSYDGDSAGQKAILRALDIFDAQDIKARVLAFPDGLDPDDFIRMHGVEGFQALKPIEPMDYRMNHMKTQHDLSTQQGRTEYAIACCNMLKAVKNPVELANHLQRLMLDTGFEKQVLLDQIGTALMSKQPKQRVSGRRSRPAELEDYQRAEQGLIRLLGSQLIPPSTVTVGDFETPVHQKIVQQLLSGEPRARILDGFDGDELKMAAAALSSEVQIDEQKALTDAEECLKTIRIHRLESALEQTNQLLETAEGEERRSLIMQASDLLQEANRLRTGRKG
ncbi:DNA primase [Eubacteriales bacterium OttesenSCG-928-N13]|nr:DNA primase [Eubacteriales bacterium OttesenSCG-928-N13]